jgi:Tol biopolymer transport system component
MRALFSLTAPAYGDGVRLIVSLLLAIVCLPVLASSASPELGSPIAIKEIGLDGQRRHLSVHEGPGPVALSPDGSHFAFVSTRSNGDPSNELKVAEVRRSRERVLVRAPGGILDVAWAANGRTIAFSAHPSRPEANDGGVFVVESDGTGLRRIAEDLAFELGWSPDASQLVIDRGSITVLSVATGELRDLGAGDRPRWSPDGQKILFERRDAIGRGEIGVAAADGGSVQIIAEGFAPSWSPNGRSVTFSASWGRRVWPALWIVPSHGGRPRLLVKWASSYSAEWSPNGRWIAYVKRREAKWPCGPRMKSTLGLVRPGNGETRELLVKKRALDLLAWSRDSRRLLYTSLLCAGD